MIKDSSIKELEQNVEILEKKIEFCELKRKNIKFLLEEDNIYENHIRQYEKEKEKTIELIKKIKEKELNLEVMELKLYRYVVYKKMNPSKAIKLLSDEGASTSTLWRIHKKLKKKFPKDYNKK